MRVEKINGGKWHGWCRVYGRILGGSSGEYQEVHPASFVDMYTLVGGLTFEDLDYGQIVDVV